MFLFVVHCLSFILFHGSKYTRKHTCKRTRTYQSVPFDTKIEVYCTWFISHIALCPGDVRQHAHKPEGPFKRQIQTCEERSRSYFALFTMTKPGQWVQNQFYQFHYVSLSANFEQIRTEFSYNYLTASLKWK